ncbi:MAG: PhzF family phenazine biosynthesis protein [Parvibaculaceae bacterium]
MTRRYSFHTLDVFTDRKFGGNPLAVVLDADDLTTEEMQTITREFNLSETIFVRKPRDSANTASVRIFFPGAEIPFAGHPTVGCAIFLAERDRKPGCPFETEIRLEEVAGLVPVKVTRIAGASRAQFTAPVIPHAAKGPAPAANEAAAALGLKPSEIGFGGHRTGHFAGGPSFLYIPVASRDALSRAKPAEPGWSAMMQASGTVGAYLYTPGGDHADTAFRARMLAPGGGIPEDPATGSATAILAGQLLASGALDEGTNRFRLEQGYEMGRPSDLWMEADVEGPRLTAVRVAGQAIPVMSGELEL